jgi:hypothetical protein
MYDSVHVDITVSNLLLKISEEVLQLNSQKIGAINKIILNSIE